MKHEMRLYNEPFEFIRSCTKTIEMKLNNEKRRLINIGDIIEFTNRATDEKLEVMVINLYKNFNKKSIGYSENEK